MATASSRLYVFRRNGFYGIEFGRNEVDIVSVYRYIEQNLTFTAVRSLWWFRLRKHSPPVLSKCKDFTFKRMKSANLVEWRHHSSTIWRKMETKCFTIWRWNQRISSSLRAIQIFLFDINLTIIDEVTLNQKWPLRFGYRSLPSTLRLTYDWTVHRIESDPKFFW